MIGLAGLDRLDPLTASSRGLGELLGAFSAEPAHLDRPRRQRDRRRRARLAGAPPAADDRVLRRADRSGRRRAHLRAAEGARARRRPDPGRAPGEARSSRGPRTGAAGGLGAKLLVARRRAGRRRRAHARRPRLRRRVPRRATPSSPARGASTPRRWRESCRWWSRAARAPSGCACSAASVGAATAGNGPPRCSTTSPSKSISRDQIAKSETGRSQIPTVRIADTPNARDRAVSVRSPQVEPVVAAARQ